MTGPRSPVALVVGEAVVDVVRSASGAVSEHAGGSPANVAVGLARLERPVRLVTDLGDDHYGDLLAAHLQREHVDLLLPRRRNTTSSSAVADIGADGGASYTFDIHWAPALPSELPDACVVHTGSLGAVLSPGAETVAALLERLAPTATVSYDLNVRPSAMGRREDVVAHVHRIAALADLVKASDEDLAYLWPDDSFADAARRLLGEGPAAVIVTRGADGAVCLTRDGQVAAPGQQVVVADTIGAGDSFCAGLIDRLWSLGALGEAGRTTLRTLDQAAWSDVLSYAGAVAAVTVSRPGADPPTRAELVTVGLGC